MPNHLTRSLIVGASLLALAACSPPVRTHGNFVDPTRLSELRTGVSKRDDVAALLGPPSTTGTFDGGESWYYIGERVEDRGIRGREVVDRRVVVIRFDAADQVAEIAELTHEDGQEFELVERQTPTAGRDLGVLEQLLGNVGRFSGAQGE